MKTVTGNRFALWAIPLAALLAFATTGCGDSVLGLDSNGTDQVRISLAVADGQPQVTYIVSNDFGVQALIDGTLEIRIHEADTVTTTLPLDRKFETGSDRRVFFRVIDTSALESSVSVRVWLDDNPVFENSVDPNEDDVQVLYLYGGGVLVPEAITVV